MTEPTCVRCGATLLRVEGTYIYICPNCQNKPKVESPTDSRIVGIK